MDLKDLKQKIFQHIRYSYGPHNNFSEFFRWARRRFIALKMEDLRNLFGKSRLSFGICRKIELVLLSFGYTFDLDFLPADQDVAVVIGPLQSCSDAANQTENPRQPEPKQSPRTATNQPRPTHSPQNVGAPVKTDSQETRVSELLGGVLHLVSQLLCASWLLSRTKPRLSVRKLFRVRRYRLPTALDRTVHGSRVP
jgi:hypothetical protein